jgi:hypothetical protein
LKRPVGSERLCSLVNIGSVALAEKHRSGIAAPYLPLSNKSLSTNCKLIIGSPASRGLTPSVRGSAAGPIDLTRRTSAAGFLHGQDAVCGDVFELLDYAAWPGDLDQLRASRGAEAEMRPGIV